MSIAAIKIDDIDFADNTVRVYDKKQQEYRIAPIHPATMKILTDYVNNLPIGQKNLFTSKFHNTFWQRLLKKANIPYIKFHSLRTCMSTWLKQAGVSDGVVTAIFGHSDPGITTRHYTALDNVEIKRDASSISASTTALSRSVIPIGRQITTQIGPNWFDNITINRFFTFDSKITFSYSHPA